MTQPPGSASRESEPFTGPHFLYLMTHPNPCMKNEIVMPAPDTLSEQLPSQKPQIPFTLVQSIEDSSFHSSLIPLAPKPAHKSASLLSSRKMCTAQSPILRHKSTPSFHHSLSCICMVSIARYDIFCFALPSIQSTTILLSPRMTNSIPSTILGGTNNKGSSSLSFLRGMPPSVILICNGGK